MERHPERRPETQPITPEQKSQFIRKVLEVSPPIAPSVFEPSRVLPGTDNGPMMEFRTEAKFRLGPGLLVRCHASEDYASVMVISEQTDSLTTESYQTSQWGTLYSRDRVHLDTNRVPIRGEASKIELDHGPMSFTQERFRKIMSTLEQCGLINE